MTQYYIFEIKLLASGEFEHTVHWAYDADATQARLKAESKYHEILATAAVSEYASHSATLITSDGRAIMNQRYTHVISTPEPEPEEETEPTSEETEEETPTEEPVAE